jgi:hypothetical protein
MNLGKMLGEDLDGLGDFAIRPQIMTDELVDLDVQPPPGVSGLGAGAMRRPPVRQNNHVDRPWWNTLFGRSQPMLSSTQRSNLQQIARDRNQFKPSVTDESPAPTHVGSLIEELQGLGAVYTQPYNSYGGTSYLPLTSPQYSQQYYAGISSPYRYGTRSWWQWYATVYLPQYYSQQQIYSLLQQNPLYGSFGWPTGYTPSIQNYGTPYNPYTGQYPNYGYNQYGIYPPNYGYIYGQQGAYGAQQCAASGGYYDYAQQQCYPQSGNYGYGAQTGTPPNVIGQSVSQGVQALNQAGYAVWERLRDGISQGSPPPTTATNRVVIDDANGSISAMYIG